MVEFIYKERFRVYLQHVAQQQRALAPLTVHRHPPPCRQSVTATSSSMAFHFRTSGSNIAITTKLSSKLLKELQSKREDSIWPNSHGVYQEDTSREVHDHGRGDWWIWQLGYPGRKAPPETLKTLINKLEDSTRTMVSWRIQDVIQGLELRR